MSYQVIASGGVRRLADDKVITRGMPEWREYLLWARKNTPLPPVVHTPTLASRREEIRRRVDAATQRAINRGPVSVGGKRFNADPSTVGALALLAAAVANGVPFPANFRWRAADGTMVPMTAQQFRTLAQDLVMHVYSCKEHAWNLIDNVIPASPNPESVDLVTGWPE